MALPVSEDSGKGLLVSLSQVSLTQKEEEKKSVKNIGTRSKHDKKKSQG